MLSREGAIVRRLLCVCGHSLALLAYTPWPVSRFMGPQIRAHASDTHTNTHTRMLGFQQPHLQVPDETAACCHGYRAFPLSLLVTVVSDVIFWGQGVCLLFI